MPKIQAGNLTMNYDQQGGGEPSVLIPYLAADYACYAFQAPTQITFGRHDTVTSTRFADRLKNGIKNSAICIFEDCSHAPPYENVPAFNEKTLAFLRRPAG